MGSGCSKNDSTTPVESKRDQHQKQKSEESKAQSSPKKMFRSITEDSTTMAPLFLGPLEGPETSTTSGAKVQFGYARTIELSPQTSCENSTADPHVVVAGGDPSNPNNVTILTSVAKQRRFKDQYNEAKMTTSFDSNPCAGADSAHINNNNGSSTALNGSDATPRSRPRGGIKKNRPDACMRTPLSSESELTPCSNDTITPTNHSNGSFINFGGGSPGQQNKCPMCSSTTPSNTPNTSNNGATCSCNSESSTGVPPTVPLSLSANNDSLRNLGKDGRQEGERVIYIDEKLSMCDDVVTPTNQQKFCGQNIET